MKILDIPQNSPEWEEYRLGKSGGSTFNKIYTLDGRKNNDILHPRDGIFDILAERVAKPVDFNDYADMVPEGTKITWAERGHILEPIALDTFCKAINKPFKGNLGVWESNYSSDIYISPDGALKSPDGKYREAVEIKCLSSDKVLEFWFKLNNPYTGTKAFDDNSFNRLRALPDKNYQAQILKYFVVNEDLEKLYFVIYTDLIPGLELQYYEFKREDLQEVIDDARQAELAQVAIINELEIIIKENI